MSHVRLHSLLFALAVLTGCAATPEPPRTVAIRLQAATALNVNAQGRPLAVVARIYKLRQEAGFRQAPYDSFLSPQKEKEALGDDLIEVREVMLVPGQRHEVVEKVSRDAAFVGVVALFRSPAPHRWRLAYATSDAARSGILVGVHGCALSNGAGANAIGPGANPLSPARCQ